MRILDRYIVTEYLKTFFIIMISFLVLFVVIDVSDNLSRLIRHNATVKLVILYFIMRVPYVFVLSFPVVVLLSALFLMNNLSRHSETTAMRAAGLSIFRISIPLLAIAFILSLFIMFVGEIILPKAELQQQIVYVEKIKKQKLEDDKTKANIYYRGKNNRYYYINFFDGYNNNLNIITILKFDDKTGHLSQKIDAISAKWKDDHWLFKKCYIRTFKNGIPVHTTYYDTTVVNDLDASPIDFIKSAKKTMSMNYFELKEYIKRLQKVGVGCRKELVDLHMKIAFPFVNFIIMFFSLPMLSTTFRSRGRGLIFAFGIFITFIFLSTVRFFQTLGYYGALSPIYAAWIPNIVFFIIGLYLLFRADRVK